MDKPEKCCKVVACYKIRINQSILCQNHDCEFDYFTKLFLSTSWSFQKQKPCGIINCKKTSPGLSSQLKDLCYIHWTTWRYIRSHISHKDLVGPWTLDHERELIARQAEQTLLGPETQHSEYIKLMLEYRKVCINSSTVSNCFDHFYNNISV